MFEIQVSFYVPEQNGENSHIYIYIYVYMLLTCLSCSPFMSCDILLSSAMGWKATIQFPIGTGSIFQLPCPGGWLVPLNFQPKDTRGCTYAVKLEGWVDPRASADALENSFLHLPGIEPQLPSLQPCHYMTGLFWLLCRDNSSVN